MPEELNPEVLAEIDEKSLSTREFAGRIVVSNAATLEAATQFVRSLKTLRREIDETFDPVIRAAHAAHRAAIASKKKHSEPIDEAERIVKTSIVAYTDEQARLRREQIAAENAEKARLAKAAEDERRRREAATQFSPVAEVAPPPPPSAPPPPVLATPVVEAPKAAGLTTKTKHVAHVDDLVALCAAIGRGDAPVDLVQASAAGLRKFAVATKGTVAVPGVSFSTETIAAVR